MSTPDSTVDHEEPTETFQNHNIIAVDTTLGFRWAFVLPCDCLGPDSSVETTKPTRLLLKPPCGRPLMWTALHSIRFAISIYHSKHSASQSILHRQLARDFSLQSLGCRWQRNPPQYAAGHKNRRKHARRPRTFGAFHGTMHKPTPNGSC